MGTDGTVCPCGPGTATGLTEVQPSSGALGCSRLFLLPPVLLQGETQDCSSSRFLQFRDTCSHLCQQEFQPN